MARNWNESKANAENVSYTHIVQFVTQSHALETKETDQAAAKDVHPHCTVHTWLCHR